VNDYPRGVFVPGRLSRRIGEIAAVIHDPIAAESGFRLNKFEQTVGLKPVTPSGEQPNSINRPAYPLVPFVEARARSVRRQLDGKSKGMILKYTGRR
jgi:hypothetical protein